MCFFETEQLQDRARQKNNVNRKPKNVGFMEFETGMLVAKSFGEKEEERGGLEKC